MASTLLLVWVIVEVIGLNSIVYVCKPTKNKWTTITTLLQIKQKAREGERKKERKLVYNLQLMWDNKNNKFVLPAL